MRTTGAGFGSSGALPATAVSVEMAPLPSAVRAVSLADVGEPIPLTWIVRSGVVIGLVIVAAIVLAIAARCSGSESGSRPSAHPTASAPANAGSGSGSARAAAAGQTKPAPAVEAKPAPAAQAKSPAAASVASRSPEREAQYKLAARELEFGKTCAERKAAVGKLVDIADARAVTLLRRALSRSGPGEEGNSCLRPDAERAIKTLEAVK